MPTKNMCSIRASLLVALLVAVSGCGTNDPSNRSAGDCTIRITFDHRTYRAHNGIDQKLRRGEALGDGQAIGCDGDPVANVGSVEIVAVAAVDPKVAVAVQGSTLDGIYVEQELADAGDLPPSLRK